MNASSEWFVDKPWTGTSAIRYVPQNVNGTDVYDYEEMRTYPDIESCLEDYAAFKVGLHQDIKGVTDTRQLSIQALQAMQPILPLLHPQPQSDYEIRSYKI